MRSQPVAHKGDRDRNADARFVTRLVGVLVPATLAQRVGDARVELVAPFWAAQMFRQPDVHVPVDECA
jgi:hypothetical protein